MLFPRIYIALGLQYIYCSDFSLFLIGNHEARVNDRYSKHKSHARNQLNQIKSFDLCFIRCFYGTRYKFENIK